MSTTASLQDDFNGVAIDSTKWPTTSAGTGNTLGEGSGTLNITLGGTSGQYALIQSTASAYDFTNSYLVIQAIAVTADSLTNSQSYIKVTLDANNYLTIGKVGTTLTCQSHVAGVDSNTTVTYNSDQMQWWRLRSEAGNILWETSASGRANSWTTQRTLANPFAITAMQIEIGAGQFGASSATTATFDNLNLAPNGIKLNNSGLRPHPFSPGLAR